MRVALLSLVAGCSFQGAPTANDANPVTDASPDAILDAPTDAPPTFACIDGFLDVCRPTEPTDDLVLANETIDTDNDLRCAKEPQGPGGPLVCVIAARDITIAAAATVRATGSLPLVLAAFDELVVDANATLDASSRPDFAGAGTGDSTCIAVNGGGGVNGGGAAGGSFGGGGGKGGNGNIGGVGATASAAAMTIDRVRGGCAGGVGGASTTVGGIGGGSIHLLAKTSITLRANGAIVASGGGGGGGSLLGGGGGGGSGGFIGLDAPLVDFQTNAKAIANGGGGGSGGGELTVGQTGMSGNATVDLAATGGTAGGGDGGDGSIGAMLLGAVGTNGALAEGGGGGGGGAGVIFAPRAAPTSGAFSPPVRLP